MPLLIILLLILLATQIGFWDTVQAVLGTVLAFALLATLGATLLALVVRQRLARLRRRFR